MKNLMIFQLRKLFHKKSFYICTVIQMAYLILSAVILRLLYKGEELPETANGATYVFTALTGSASITLLSLIVTLFVGEDKVNDTLKNVYSRGYSPVKVIASELITVTIASVIFCFASFIAAYLTGPVILSGAGKLTGKEIGLLLLQIFAALGFTALFFMFAKLIKGNGGAIAVNIMAPAIIEIGFMLLNSFIKKGRFNLGAYSPQGILNTFAEVSSTASQIGVGVVIAVIYTAAFVTLSFVFNRKRAV